MIYISYIGINCVINTIKSGITAIETDKFNMIANKDYTFQCLILNNSKYDNISLYLKKSTGTLTELKTFKLSTLANSGSVDFSNEKNLSHTFKSDIALNNVKILIGRNIESGDIINSTLFSIRKSQIKQSSMQTTYEENAFDSDDSYLEMNTKIEQLADSISFKASKSEYKNLSDRTEQTEMKLTPEGLSILVKDGGGSNLLKNSLFKRDFKFWNYTNSTNCKLTTNGCYIVGGLQKTYIISQEIDIKNNSQDFSVSGEFGVTDYSVGTTNTKTSIYLKAVFEDGTEEYKDLIWIDGKVGWNWKYIADTHRFSKPVKKLFVHMYGRDFTGKIWLRNLMCNASKFPRKWENNADELYESEVSIDSEGIQVEHSESNSYTRLNSEGLKIYNLNGSQLASFGENNTAIIDNMIVDTIKNNQFSHIASKGSYKIYISPEGAGNKSGTSFSNAACGFSEGLRLMKELIGTEFSRHGGNMTLNLTDIYFEVASGTYYEDFGIRNITGSGSINFNINANAIIRGTVKIQSCYCPVYFNGFKTSTTTNNGALIKPRGGQAFQIKNSNYISAKNIRLRSEVLVDAAIYLTQGSNMYIENVDVYKFDTCVYASGRSQIAMFDCCGSGQNIGCNLKEGSTASYEGKAFSQRFIRDGASSYIALDNTGANSVQTGSSDSEPVNKVMSKYFEPSYYSSVRNNSEQNNILNQGSWTTSGAWIGYINLDTEVTEWLKDATGIQAQVKLKRQNTSHGISGAAEVWLDGKYRLGTLSKGEEKWFVIPSAYVNELKAGKGYLKFNSNDRNDYIKFELNSSLWLQATKPTK